jgi:hypothetical protein
MLRSGLETRELLPGTGALDRVRETGTLGAASVWWSYRLVNRPLPSSHNPRRNPHVTHTISTLSDMRKQASKPTVGHSRPRTEQRASVRCRM